MDIKLRQIVKEDSLQLFEWANDQVVRKFSFSPKRIKWSDHQVWFKNRLNRDDCWIYIAINKGGEPIGQIRFEAVDSDVIQVDFSLCIKHRRKGLGVKFIQTAIHEMLSIDVKYKKIIAWVKIVNVASQKTFKRAGFIKLSAGGKSHKNCICLAFELSEKESL